MSFKPSEVCEEYSEGEQFARLSVFASLKKNKKKNLPNLGKIFLDQTVIILKINNKKKKTKKDNFNYYSKCFHQ